MTYSRYDQPKFRDLQARLAAENTYDFIMFDHVHTTHAMELFPNAVRVVDTQNNDITMYKRWAENRPEPFSRLFGNLQASLCRRFLQRTLPKLDATFAVSQKEADEFGALANGINALAVPNGVDTDYFSFGTGEREPETLLFLGNMGWLPNADGCEFLLRDIMPEIQKRRPNVHLVLAGHEPRPNVMALAGPGVEVTGFVPDVRTYLHSATVFIVPLRIGAGTRLKILEAMAAGIPVVSTSVGCEGIAGEDGRHLLVRDDPKAFAEAVLDLIEHPEKRQKLIDAAHGLVSSTYEWRIITRRMVEEIDALLAARRAT
ncbi:MAG: glycosyltransferase [Phycisphaerales bacterium]|nr:glycosyltransferase [Phycisphaerales bacterium]